MAVADKVKNDSADRGTDNGTQQTIPVSFFRDAISRLHDYDDRKQDPVPVPQRQELGHDKSGGRGKRYAKGMPESIRFPIKIVQKYLGVNILMFYELIVIP